MEIKELDKELLKKILVAQRSELTEYVIYHKLAQAMKDAHNREVVERISRDELAHYQIWKEYSHQELKPDKITVWKYLLIIKLFGITFGLKLMERGEEAAQVIYQDLSSTIPEAVKLLQDEGSHEKELLNLLDEERLKYIGSIVLGLNDALVELTGALAGFTLALQNTRLIALVGLVTGIAGALSMASSEFLSTKTETVERPPLKASLYTGIAYLLTVLFLIFPYLILKNFYFALGLTVFNAILVILIFTYYISVAKDLPFSKRFLEMASISLGVATLSFALGFIIRRFFKIEI